MKAKPAILKHLARAAWEGGKSTARCAALVAVPVGTVKAWRARGKWKREGLQVKGEELEVHGSKDEPTFSAGETRHDEPPKHRGLNWTHMPGRPGSKMLTFAMFSKGLWPPRQWRVPKDLEGGALLMLLQERACLGQSRKAAKKTGRGKL